MGMFDDVICEVPLPDGWKHTAFQTKDFDEPYLNKYIIRADGRLVLKRPWERSEPEATTYEDMNFHGTFKFYSYEGDPNDETPLMERWHEYTAKFTDGNLVSIETSKRNADGKSE